jgi:hypothetical protein
MECAYYFGILGGRHMECAYYFGIPGGRHMECAYYFAMELGMLTRETASRR